jgi:hypothetical protein
MSVDDTYSERTFRTEPLGSDTPPKSHFYDEVEECIHNLIAAFSEGVFWDPPHPVEGLIAMHLCGMFSDYYYDRGAIARAYPAIRELIATPSLPPSLLERVNSADFQGALTRLEELTATW